MEKLDDIKKALISLSDSIHEYDMVYWCAGLKREAMEEIESLSTIEEDAQERAHFHFLMEMVEEVEKSLQGLSSASKSLLKNLFRIAR